jgi:hypothetical protein
VHARVTDQPFNEALVEHRGGRPEATAASSPRTAFGVIERKTERRLPQYLAGGTVAWIAIAGYFNAHDPAIIGLTQETYVVVSGELGVGTGTFTGLRQHEAL